MLCNFSTYDGFRVRIFIADPAIIKQVFVKEFSNFRDRQVCILYGCLD